MWNLSYISREDLTVHVKETIKKYGEKLTSYDIKKFNSNLIDPIKLAFDKNVYQVSWEDIIKNEIFRQRDKSSNNDIGYFHQNIFRYITNCEVPQSGWDVIHTNKNGITIDGYPVKKVFVEMKNKHNTMNSAAAGKTYIKMQNALLQDDDSACFLVEVIAKTSQNIKWETTVDKNKVGHKLIRRVSIDKFYELVTGETDAFYKLCMVLPEIIEDAVKNSSDLEIPNDIVFQQLKMLADEKGITISMALYLLVFNNYLGF